eukprot:2435128-Pleurochrysis_carterae.AAC.1
MAHALFLPFSDQPPRQPLWPASPHPRTLQPPPLAPSALPTFAFGPQPTIVPALPPHSCLPRLVDSSHASDATILLH